MIRRSHRKTKKGSKCDECRRRHIRCDQQHPTCINCQSSDRVCTYRPGSQARDKEASPIPDISSHSISNDSTHLPQPPQPPTVLLSLQGGRESPVQTQAGSLVNITHLELFNHVIQGSFLFIGQDTGFTDQLKRTALSSAFADPCLMHAILALSARHLSTQVSPEKSRSYLDESTSLQTWAVANFNPAPCEPDQDACVAMFLFSSLICMHELAGVADLNLDPEPFFIRFGQYFGLQRGVRTIIGDHWVQLQNSEIGSLLQWCDRASSSRGQGSECEPLRQLVAESTDLSQAAIYACNFAIEQLQCVLDEYTPRQPMPVHCVYLTLAWPLLIPDKLIDLLVLRRPIALLILAYYGAILDCCSDLWMVGAAGKRIVYAVNKYLDSHWASWLRWPCEAVGIEAL
ncbi:hypothetical protein F4777DRAFT_560760 [Nemania sp. FL0916]|nr:hypothetical protein F4777DRAFT_560760 [Nemania sp. FL0916]